MKFIVFIVQTAIRLFYKYRFIVVNKREYTRVTDYYREVLIESGNYKENRVDSVVFSKDRAMQLHAFLASFITMVDGYGTMYILYKASNERHLNSYTELKGLFKDYPFIFIEEQGFRSQLINICESSTARVLGFFVDDMIFTQKVDFNFLATVNTFKYIPVLSRGKDFNYSQVLNKSLTMPEFIAFANGFHRFKWDESNEFSDWTYPLGVSGYFYGRDEIVVMFKTLNFKAPNSLETMMQEYMALFVHRTGLCYSKVACVCVHANIVQSEADNPVLGTFSVEELLCKWEAGLKIDVRPFIGKGSEAQYSSYSFYCLTPQL